MCRIAAYAGPPVTLSAVLYDPPHSLERQAYRPNELVHGTVNVDGTGVAWWDDQGPEPLRYVSTATPWGDPNLPTLAGRLRSRMLIGAVRSATPGLSVGTDHVAPFAAGRLAGAHNGRIGGFRGGVGRAIVDRLPDAAWAELGVLNDSKALFQLVAAVYEGDLVTATTSAMSQVTAILDEHGASATLNLVVADGQTIVATRHSVRGMVNSLYVAARDAAHLVASEPLDDGGDWKPVAEHQLVALTAESMTAVPLE